MTRFIVHIEDSIECIEYALETTGHNIIPNLKAFKVKDLFDIYKEEFSLAYEHGQLRISEKNHELMIAPEEIDRVFYDKEHDMYLMHYKHIHREQSVPENGLNSKDWTISKEDLRTLLKKYNYFKPE